MAQLNITLNQDEILQMLGDDTGTAFKALLQESLNAVLRAESTEQIQAEPYERTDNRQDSRNGTRKRPLTTRIGRIELTVPRHRNEPFHTMVFENYKRSEAALVTTMAEMVVGGVSTAKVSRVMETLCGTSFSKSTVSEACKELDSVVSNFLERPINDHYLFVMVDATYLKVRENHRIVSKSLMVAIGFTQDGHKELIGFNAYGGETKENWTNFLKDLRKRGLRSFKMLTSDAHEGILAAKHEVFPDVPWQRCQTHFTKNILAAAPKKLQAGLYGELVEVFNCKDLESARIRKDEIIADYAELAPDAMNRLDKGFDDAMTVMVLPEQMRRCVRTTNYIERLNREIKRRTNVFGIFPNVGSLMRLAGAYLIEENDRWENERKLYYHPAVEELEQKTLVLVEIAKLQKEMMQAA